jgi:hypothetical protein
LEDRREEHDEGERKICSHPLFKDTFWRRQRRQAYAGITAFLIDRWQMLDKKGSQMRPGSSIYTSTTAEVTCLADKNTVLRRKCSQQSVYLPATDAKRGTDYLLVFWRSGASY